MSARHVSNGFLLCSLLFTACVDPRRRDAGALEAGPDAAVEDTFSMGPDAPGPDGPPPDLSMQGSEAEVPDAPGPDAPPPDVPPPDASDMACGAVMLPALRLPRDMVMATLTGASRNTSTSCTTERGTQGPEAVFPITVTETVGVDVQVVAGFDTAIAIRRVCNDALTEVACNNDRPGGDPNPRLRARLDPGTYYVIVDTVGFGVGGPVSISLDTFPAFAWGRCSAARALTGSGEPLTMQDTAGGLESAHACLPMVAPDANALFYRINVPVGARLETTVQPTMATGTPPWDPVLRVLPVCDSSTCTASSNAGGLGAPESITYINRTPEAQSLVLAVSSANASLTGTFSLDARVTPAPSNAACASPQTLTTGMSLSRVSFQQALARDLAACRAPRTGTMLFYSAEVPAGRRLTVTATPAGTPTARAAVRIFDACAASTCLASSDDATATGVSANARFLNDGSSSRTVLVGVLNTEPETASVDISASIGVAPPSASCGTAPTASVSTPLRGEDLNDGGPALVACGTGAGRAARYYRVVVPGRQALAVTATAPAGEAAPTLRVLPDCTGAMCLASATNRSGTTSARWSNPDASPRAVIVVASQADGSTAATRFDLTVSLRDPPANVACAGAQMLTVPSTLMGEDATDARENLGAVCVPTSPTGVLYYRVSAPPGQSLVVVSTPRTGTATLRFLEMCDSVGCTASATGTPTAPATLVFTNPSETSARPLVLAASVDSMGAPALYDLNVSARMPAANGRCAAPTMLTSGTPVRGELASAGRDPSSTACLSSFDQPSLYYRATVPAASELAVTVAPTVAASSPVVRVMTACGATSCLANNVPDGRTAPTGTTTTRYRNTGASAQDVIISVTPARAGEVVFDITATTTLLPYIPSTVPASCDDMAAATTFTEVFGDDSGSRSVALPFPFSFFGDAMLSFGANSNGLVQLFAVPAASSMLCTATYQNDLFFTSPPANIIAAMWDDLIVDMGTGMVRYRDVPAAGSVARHLTIEWNNMRPLSTMTTSPRSTFQAKLFADNAIELHYCRLGDGSPLYTGGSASIGLVGSSTMRTYVHSHNQADAVNTMTAIRLVPPLRSAM